MKRLCHAHTEFIALLEMIRLKKLRLLRRYLMDTNFGLEVFKGLRKRRCWSHNRVTLVG